MSIIQKLRCKAFLWVLHGVSRPFCYRWGFSRGSPIDRYYTERFLKEHQEDIRGSCLEVLDAGYIRKFGGNKVEKIDVLDIDPNNKEATIIADLCNATCIPDNTYDCIILTFVLQYIPNALQALKEIQRTLKPDGVLLISVPCVQMIDPDAKDYWRFTEDGLTHMLVKVFGKENQVVEAHGNVMVATAFLMGLAQHELSITGLDNHDPLYPVTLTARAVKRA